MKPTQMSGFLFFQELFSFQLFYLLYMQIKRVFIFVSLPRISYIRSDCFVVDNSFTSFET